VPKYSRAVLTTKEKQKRQDAGYRVHGYKGFVDEFPIGFGTLPEKIVYWALSQRNIPFYYLNDLEINIPEIGFDQFFQADFILPTLRIVIEVQGAHWHSMTKTIEEDALKFAYYQQTGWQPLAWWDFDIENNVNALFDQVPALAAASQYDGSNKSAELTPMRRTKTDSSKGIRTLNARRGARLSYRKKPITVKSKKRKTYGSFTTYGR
jgi:G:T-mismatch repair DNA endonuclease (very short patch repair protein)